MFTIFMVLVFFVVTYLATMIPRVWAFDEMMRDIEKDVTCNKEGIAEAFDEAMPLLKGK